MIARMLHVKPYLHSEAVKELLTRKARIFHIATHTYNDMPELSAPMGRIGLLFANGARLSAEEISRLPLNDTELKQQLKDALTMAEQVSPRVWWGNSFFGCKSAKNRFL